MLVLACLTAAEQDVNRVGNVTQLLFLLDCLSSCCDILMCLVPLWCMLRYIPGLVQQLELSLLQMLPLLQPADATRLKEPLRRNQQLLLSLAAKAAAGSTGQHQPAAAAGATASAAVTARHGHAGHCLHNIVCTTDENCLTALAQGQHAAGRGMLASGPADGSAKVDGQCAAQSALPADPFGQGTRLSSNGGASAGSVFSGVLLDPPDAVKGLCQVLGPGVIDAWAEVHGNIPGEQQVT